MPAPCGEKYADFIKDMGLDPAHVHLSKEWQSRIEFALYEFNEEKHFTWVDYRDEMVRQLDARVPGWRVPQETMQGS